MNDINLGNMKIPVIKPQKGVDYYTEAEKQELIEETTKKVNQIIEPKETERQANEQIRKLNEEDRKAQESTRIANENERQINEDTRQNDEATRQNSEAERQSNEQARNEAEQSRNTTFNNQMTENEKAIQNIKEKTSEYNANAETKTNEFNSNAEQKTQTFNENANAKLQEINQIKDTTEAKIAEINEKDESQDTEISEIKQEQIIQNTKIQTLETDNATNKQEILEQKQKNTEQDTKIKQNTDNIELLIKENIQLKAKDIELEEENKRLREDLNNTVPGVPGEGENITLKSTANARFKKFVPGGNSWQETREGYNLLDFNVTQNSNVIVNNNGTITINGTGGFRLNFKSINLKSGKTYSEYIELISGNIDRTDNTGIMDILNTEFLINNTKKSITITEDTTKESFWISGSITYTNATFKIWLYEGTEEKTYEPYGAMPSTDYKSDIQNVTGNANVTICNKNLFKIDKTIFPFSKNGLDFSLNKDGNLVVNGTSEKYTEFNICGNGKDFFFKLFKGKSYKFDNGTTNNNLSMYYSGERLVQFNNGTARKIDKDMRMSVLKLQVPVANVTFVNEVFKLQFVEVENLSSPVTDYTPHQSQSFTFPLSEGQRLMKNDYLADDGIHHKMKRFVLTGNEEVDYQVIDNTEFSRFLVRLQNLAQCDITHEIAYSNMFKLLNTGETYAAKEGFTVINNKIWIYADKWKNSTLEDVKAEIKALYEAGTPLYFDITLDEEEIEAYTPEQQVVYNQIKKTAKSYGDTTHIFSTDEISPIFNVEANADIQAMFNNLQAQILAGEV